MTTSYDTFMTLLQLSLIFGEMWTYVAFLVVVYVLYALRDYIRIFRFISTLDGPKTVPILGNANVLLEGNLMQRMTNEASNYGRIFRIWLTFLPYVVLLEPEDIQAVLGSMKHTRKICFYKLLDNFIGKGLISLEVNKWKLHRKILQPAFHFHVLKKFTGTFSECADHLVDKLLERNTEDVNLTVLINNCVYEILKETILGMSASRGYNDTADTPFKKGQVMLTYRFARPWLLIDWIYRLTAAGKLEEQQQKDLFDFCFRKMKEKREFLRKNDSIAADGEPNTATTRKISLLEYMVVANERDPHFIEQDIIEECCTFMLAGMESVSTSTAMTLFLLASNPKWQERCIAELDEIFGNDKRSPTMQDLREMKCLEMCIKESLRLYPSVPLFARILGEDVRIGKQVIPAGCGVFVIPYCTHRLPHYFPDPHVFKPERFSPENSKGRHSYAYLPFSAGPRNCIGNKFAMLEIKSIMSAVLRKCRLESIRGKDQVIAKFRMTVRAQGGLWVKVKARDKRIESQTLA